MNRFFIIISLLSLLGCATPKTEVKSPSDDISDKFMTFLMAKDYTLATTLFTKKLKKSLPAKELSNLWSKELAAHGTPIGYKRVNKIDGADIIKIEYPTSEVLFKIPIDESGQIAGLWIVSVSPRYQGSTLIESFDGLELEALISSPKGSSERVKKVVIFIHGSGPQDMDGTPNKIFATISKGLTAKGIATIRYNKRTFQVNKNTLYGVPSKEFYTEEFNDNYLTYFIKDAEIMIAEAKKRFPNARPIIFGHSQGSYLALQIANTNREVKGLVLAGSNGMKINEITLEQSVYRNLSTFYRLDRNRNMSLSKRELKKAPSIYKQMKTIDQNHDGQVSLSEYKAALYSNILASNNKTLDSWLRQEVMLPKPTSIIKKLKVNTLFVQGELDNQTQVYYPQALKLLNDTSWKKKNLHFKFYKGLGHTLNPQRKFLEFNNNNVPKRVVENLVREMEWL